MTDLYIDPRDIFIDNGESLESDTSFSFLNTNGLKIYKSCLIIELRRRFLILFRGDKDRSCWTEEAWLERAYKKTIKFCNKEIKHLKKTIGWFKDPLDEYSIDFIAYVIKSELVKEYLRIQNIIELCEEKKPEDIEFDDWYKHEIYYPEESIEDWMKREEEISHQLDVFKKYRDDMAD